MVLFQLFLHFNSKFLVLPGLNLRSNLFNLLLNFIVFIHFLLPFLILYEPLDHYFFPSFSHLLLIILSVTLVFIFILNCYIFLRSLRYLWRILPNNPLTVIPEMLPLRLNRDRPVGLSGGQFCFSTTLCLWGEFSFDGPLFLLFVQIDVYYLILRIMSIQLVGLVLNPCTIIVIDLANRVFGSDSIVVAQSILD